MLSESAMIALVRSLPCHFTRRKPLMLVDIDSPTEGNVITPEAERDAELKGWRVY